MTVKEFMSYLMAYHCPHDIFRNMEPEQRCTRFMNDHGPMGCTVCWIVNIEEHKEEVEE